MLSANWKGSQLVIAFLLIVASPMLYKRIKTWWQVSRLLWLTKEQPGWRQFTNGTLPLFFWEAPGTWYFATFFLIKNEYPEALSLDLVWKTCLTLKLIYDKKWNSHVNFTPNWNNTSQVWSSLLSSSFHQLTRDVQFALLYFKLWFSFQVVCCYLPYLSLLFCLL